MTEGIAQRRLGPAHRAGAGGFALCLFAVLVTAAQASAQARAPGLTPPAPLISTFSLGLPIPWEECRTRVSRALAAEGFLNPRDFGNGWEAWARGGAVSIACLAGVSQTILTVVTTGPEGFDLIGERTRLVNRIRVEGVALSPPPPQQIGEGWQVNASSVRGRSRQRFAVVCPPNGQPRPVWGSDTYTDDSSVCGAGAHVGVITMRGGGTVTIEVRPGMRSYEASDRNGVGTINFGESEGSFVVVRPAVTTTSAGPATGGSGWNATAARHRGRNGERFTFSCPAGGIASGVWGTDVYSDDSSVCAAAVHAGLISLVTGGSVAIEIRAAAPTYQASTRRGVASASLTEAAGSFVFR
jgi:hypothetical protein